jgi:WD40 repeat protein
MGVLRVAISFRGPWLHGLLLGIILGEDQRTQTWVAPPHFLTLATRRRLHYDGCAMNKLLTTAVLLVGSISALGQDALVRTYEGHPGKLNNLAISPDGDLALSTADDRSVRIWEVESGKMVHVLESHKNLALCGAFSPNGRLALSGGGLEPMPEKDRFFAGKDHKLRLWDVVTGKELKQLAGHKAPVWAIQFFSDNRRAVSGGGWNNPPTDTGAYLWDVEKGTVLQEFKGHTQWIRGLAIMPGEKQIVSCSWDKTLRVWDVETGAQTKLLQDHKDFIFGLAVARDGKRILSGGGTSTGGDCDLRVWDPQSGKVLMKLPGHTLRVWGVAVSKDGKRALSCAADKSVRLWDLTAGKEIQRFDGHSDEVRAVAFALGDRYALSASHDKTLRLWKLP